MRCFWRVSGCWLAAMALMAGPAIPAARAETTLIQALTQVYQGNPRLLAARARARAVDETVPEALAGWRPKLNATASTGFKAVRTEDDDQNANTSRVALTLDQPLNTGGAVAAEVDAAKRRVLAQHADLRAIEQEILLETAVTYAAVYRDQLILGFALENEQRLLQQLTIVRGRHDGGAVTDTDLAQAESRYEGAISERIQAKADLMASGAAYRRIVGQPPEDLSTPLPLARVPLSEADALSKSAYHPALIAAQEAFEASRFDVDRAQSELRPKFLLRGEVSHVDQPSTLIDRETSASISTILTIPFYQGGGASARVRRSRQTVTERRYLVDDTRLAVEAQVVEGWQALVAAKARARSLEAQLDAALLALTGVQAEADIGLRTISDVLDAERELFTVQVETARLLRDHVVASYQLKAAVGDLSVAALELETAPYAPNQHYDAVRDKWFGTGDAVEDQGLTPEGDRQWQDRYWFLRMLNRLEG
ncbi:MAG: TolC family outer membrane protein [Pseudomonadota bacterium]